MRLNLFSHPLLATLRAKWLHRRGMMRAQLRQHRLAIEDYTAVIEMELAPPSVRAMALYNRALVYYAMDSQSQSIEDLTTVLEMSGADNQVRVEAKRKLVRMKRSSDRTADRDKSNET